MNKIEGSPFPANRLSVEPLLETNPVENSIKKSPKVFKIESLTEIQISYPEKTLFLFDLDDTTFDFPHMLGSKAWRRYIVEATKKMDSTQNWHDIFSYLLAQKHPLKTVEACTSPFIKDLQGKNHVACGLTSRERQRWYNTPQKGVDELTTRQLQSLNIDFNNKNLENHYPYLALDSEYYAGTFFADTDLKGEYVLRLFKGAPELPPKVIFFDDKQNQAESVAKALAELGIEHECYFYCATDKKAKTFNPLIANIQLYYFIKSNYQDILSDEEATLIAQQEATKDTEYYLKECLAIQMKEI